MRRRDFTSALLLATATSPARAQLGPRQRRLALVHSAIPIDQLTAASSFFWVRRFHEELGKLGYIEGQNLSIARYSAEGRPERFGDLARKVAATAPDVIVSNLNGLVLALKAATTTIPIVAIIGDPISTGVVTSLARPGGNVTGVSIDTGVQFYGKGLQILKELIPSASRIADLAIRSGWEVREQAIRDAGGSLGLSVLGVTVGEASPSQFQRAFAEIARRRADAIILSPSGDFLAHGRLIVELAEASHLPTMYPYRDFVELGGLIAYAPDLAELAENLAKGVHQVLSGAKPGDIPIYQASKFTLVVNLKTAKTLGLAVPQTILIRADEVIE